MSHSCATIGLWIIAKFQPPYCWSSSGDQDVSLSYDPYSPARTFIAKLLRKSPYEGCMRWREQGRKKLSGPARIAYGSSRDANQLCCYLNPNFSAKMSNVSEHSDREFYFPKKKKKEKRRGHMIKCLLTELGRAGRENIWPSVMVHGRCCARSVRHDLGPNIFSSGPPTQSIST